MHDDEAVIERSRALYRLTFPRGLFHSPNGLHDTPAGAVFACRYDWKFGRLHVASGDLIVHLHSSWARRRGGPPAGFVTPLPRRTAVMVARASYNLVLLEYSWTYGNDVALSAGPAFSHLLSYTQRVARHSALGAKGCLVFHVAGHVAEKLGRRLPLAAVDQGERRPHLQVLR